MQDLTPLHLTPLHQVAFLTAIWGDRTRTKLPLYDGFFLGELPRHEYLGIHDLEGRDGNGRVIAHASD
jgi:hypothetical protein